MFNREILLQVREGMSDDPAMCQRVKAYRGASKKSLLGVSVRVFQEEISV